MDFIIFILKLWRLLGSLVLFLSLLAEGFNLDVRIPVIKKKDAGSFFGFSVAQHQTFTGTSKRSVLLVGAPKANTSQPGTNSPGTVYVCPISTRRADCRQIDLRNFTNDRAPPEDEIADDGWLGVSLSSRGPGGQVVACAHRYKKIESADSIWGLGMCHLFAQDLTTEGFPYEACAGQKTTRGHEDFGVCQAGVASQLAEDDTLVLGTPGALNWRGALFSIATSANRLDAVGLDKRWFSSELSDYRAFVNKVSYLGMSVTSGYYLGGKQMIYIAGAPRSNLTGEVFIFRKQVDGRNRTLELLGKHEGEQVASQYGYSLATVDLNNDSFPDLIVGAPFHFQSDGQGGQKGGAVYVYINSADGIQYAKPKKLIGPAADSSFGFALADAGDLNLDGYHDLAVGAPYDEGGGSIHIFQGSATGSLLEASQIIRGKDLPIPLVTLGYSLSGGLDLDDNGYPDLLGGAYASDAVVLLRTRPVIKVITEVIDLPKYVNDPYTPEQYCLDNEKNLTCFSFRPCFRVASQSLNSFNGQMRIEYRIEAETFQKSSKQYSRVKFQAGDQQTPNVVRRIVVVTSNNWNRELCDANMKETVLLQDTPRDVLNPIGFKLTYTLLVDPATFPAEGDPLPSVNNYPILDQTNASKIFYVKFYKDCGGNDICESDLRISATLSLPTDAQNNYILSLGENNLIYLNLTLRNENESAYQTYLYVDHPKTLQYIGADNKRHPCSHLKEKDIPQRIRCDIGNPFPHDGEVNISMRFNTSDLDALDRAVSITLYANTTSVQPDREPLVISANIVNRADVEIRGASDPLELFYSGFVTGASAVEREEQIGLAVNHTFEIRNRGPAKVSSSIVNISWPLEVENGLAHGKYLLYLLQQPILDGPVDCKVDPKYVNPASIPVERPVVGLSPKLPQEDAEPLSTPASSRLAPAPSSVLTDTPRSRQKREKIVQHEERQVDNKRIKIVRLDCERRTAKCINITCHIRELGKDQPVVIRLRARLWNSTFMEDYRDIDTIEIKSHATVSVNTPYPVEDPTTNNQVSIMTTAKRDVTAMPPAGGVPWWGVLLAVLGGIGLLAIVCYLLYKCGFFKRKTAAPPADASPDADIPPADVKPVSKRQSAPGDRKNPRETRPLAPQ